MKRLLTRASRWIIFTLVGVLAGALIGGCALSAPTYKGPKSDHFDGDKFINLEPNKNPTSGFDFIKWQLTREEAPWNDYVEKDPGPKPPERVGKGELRVTFINHATTLIQMDGLNILTDPIYSQRASPFGFAGPSRRVPPGVRFDDLPPIDIVVVGHNHYDHMDVPTLKKLSARNKPRVFAGLGNKQFLDKQGILNVTELDWWQSQKLTDDVTLHSVPVQHFSNRGLFDRDGTLWTGYVFESKAGPVFFSSDTGLGPHFKKIAERFGPMRLAILPIGAFRPEWFMNYVHMTPEQSLEAHAHLKAQTSVGMHFGTFQLADDGQFEPVHRIKLALDKAPEPKPNFWVLGFGEGRDVPALIQ